MPKRRSDPVIPDYWKPVSNRNKKMKSDGDVEFNQKIPPASRAVLQSVSLPMRPCNYQHTDQHRRSAHQSHRSGKKKSDQVYSRRHCSNLPRSNSTSRDKVKSSKSPEFTLENNRYLTNLKVSHDERAKLKNIQGTYIMRHRSSGEYQGKVWLIWDESRLWGAFLVGPWQGIMFIDKGPDRASPAKYDMTWRGENGHESSPFHGKGYIWIGHEPVIHGRFDGMFHSNGLRDSFEFQAERRSCVPQQLDEYIQEWERLRGNDSNRKEPSTEYMLLSELLPGSSPVNAIRVDSDEDESEVGPEDDVDTLSEDENDDDDGDREYLDDGDEDDEDDDEYEYEAVEESEDEDEGGRDSDSDSTRSSGTLSPDPQDPIPPSPAQFENVRLLELLTGRFYLNSEDIDSNWPQTLSSERVIHLHVQRERNKLWGKFRIGTWGGLMQFIPSVDNLLFDQSIIFNWQGLEIDTGQHMKANGSLFISENGTVKGTFKNLGGDCSFTGERDRTMPVGESGFGLSEYRRDWKNWMVSSAENW
ncbi:hypothetical protein ASPWEDRAFT_28679 [Aspergillus wentii DTO 134E9]|uniref:Uncharacterized protein n=1 Tax=Aspergillus wentii DTO 134E9 TaxID=1073089 RepID=A0A1L9RMB9_ASPWE|nr:uncharacterized protein ASPWEDRAFT_28679 [Aspergillus wentii DTO 134E9]KAI9929463.1 hypothetical protein MW887_000935 [Aspergillus wentii]OJJ36095.1 hypothetical protein ASPWEDRAFT_28679 [Aspergillus wentii DTO 134E9]